MRILWPLVFFIVFGCTTFVLYRWIEGGAAVLQKKNQLTIAKPFTVSKNNTFNRVDFNLSESSNQPTIIHFWATWCGPCVEELPELLHTIPKLKDMGFQIITVAEDSSWKDIEDFFKKYPHLKKLTTETNLILDSDRMISVLYNSERFPETYVIDKNFKLISVLIGVQKWKSSQLEAFFKKVSTP